MKRTKSRIWAEFRFAVVGGLVFAQLDRNELAMEINRLWNHIR